MAKSFSISVGTVGTGAWHSGDGGETWKRVGQGLWNESRVFGVTAHPTKPEILYVGTDDGIYRSNDRGASFEHLDSPMNTMHVWKIAIDPVDPDTMFAGTRPAALFGSRDAGKTWQTLPVDMASECDNVRIPRVTSLAVDPTDHRVVWAGVEVDGVRRSLDGGETWSRVADGLNDPDIHDVAISVAATTTVLIGTPREIFASTDTGHSWRGLGVAKHFHFPYCRSIALRADDPTVIFVATGDGATGSTGAIQRSTDAGQSWQMLTMPVEPNTPMWAFATHPADPGLILACSHYGQLFRSDDGGDSWVKLRREFTEIRALAWMPN
jgi:photosystem II stability/assembly factor-like uncharacterized protein